MGGGAVAADQVHGRLGDGEIEEEQKGEKSDFFWQSCFYATYAVFFFWWQQDLENQLQ